jgi:hypothetical protein
LWFTKPITNYFRSKQFFRLRLLKLNSEEIRKYTDDLDLEAKEIKDEIFRLSWYMRGGVDANDLFFVYSYEDRSIMNKIIKDNIEATRKTGLNLI